MEKDSMDSWIIVWKKLNRITIHMMYIYLVKPIIVIIIISCYSSANAYTVSLQISRAVFSKTPPFLIWKMQCKISGISSFIDIPYHHLITPWDMSQN